MSTATPTVYKTLISGTLVQRTAFSVGGRDTHARVDSPVARDGQGRLTLRGSGIAGAFIADAARLLGRALPKAITAGSPGEQAQARREAKEQGHALDRLPESVWRFHTSHPENAPALEVRSGVGIRQDTGAAAEHLKYEVETIPAGTRWPFLLEVDEYRDDPEGIALPLALHVVQAWGEVCLLGRNVARGLGWMQLDPATVRVLRLEPADALEWPDSRRTPAEALDALAAKPERLLAADAIAGHRAGVPVTPRPTYLGTGIIHIGHDPQTEGEQWGLDTLSLGGSAALESLQEDFLTPLAEAHPGDFAPDLVLAWTKAAGGKLPLPFLPGSGLRGPMRHGLSWWLRSREGETVHDPNTTAGRRGLAKKQRHPEDDRDPIERLFGTGPHAGALLISDAELIDPQAFGRDAVILFEQHAEDEFTGGTYAEAKFNRIALVRGSFRFHYRIEAETEAQLQDYRRLLAILADLGRARHIPIGGANWRGHGWVRWELELPPETPETDSETTTAPETDPEDQP